MHKYKYKYLKLAVKYNLSTPALEHIKCETESKPLITQNISKYLQFQILQHRKLKKNIVILLT